MADSYRNPVTLSRYILQEQKSHKEAQGDLTILLASIQLAVKVISVTCAKAGSFNMYGLDGSKNATGDIVKKLDVFSNESMINALSFSGRVSCLVSEEEESPIILKESLDGKYFVAFDPLDGSSNIDANVSVGTIFGIWKQEKPVTKVEDLLQPASKLVAAGYSVYGAATMLVLTTGSGVNGFTLDPSVGEFILTHENLKIPKSGNIYSVNEGNFSLWDEPTKTYVNRCKNPDPPGKPKSLRYVGSMVADVHRTILYGGVFLYPADKKNKSGKLRLLYEGGPMAFILDQAGGAATTGRERVLDIVPTSIHQKTPVFLGSIDDVLEVEALYKEYDAKAKTDSKEAKA